MAFSIAPAEKYSQFAWDWLDELRKALIERATAVGWTVPTVWQSELPKNELVAYLVKFQNLVLALADGASGSWAAQGGTVNTGSFYGWAKVNDFATRDFSRVRQNEMRYAARTQLGYSSDIIISTGGSWQIDYRWAQYWKECLKQLVVLVPYEAREQGGFYLLSNEIEEKKGNPFPSTWTSVGGPDEYVMQEEYFQASRGPLAGEYYLARRSRFVLYDTGVARDMHAYATIRKPIYVGGVTAVYDQQSSSYTEGSLVRYQVQNSIPATASESDWSALGAAVPNTLLGHRIGWRGILETVLFDFSNTFVWQ